MTGNDCKFVGNATCYNKREDLRTPDHQMLIALRDELYHCNWDEMEKDLRMRLESKPYIFKLIQRINDDLERIAGLRKYEIVQRRAKSDFDVGECLSCDVAKHA